MNYGQMIRVARKKLNLNQSDLANNNISRTLVSEIEKGNTNLVTSKALLIYKKLIEEAYLQNTNVTIDFDKVLENNFEYVQLKQGRDILTRLIQSESEDKSISKFELENFRIFALRSEIGIFKYYIFRSIAANIKEDIKFKCKVLFNALDFLKWANFKNIYQKYDETLKEVTSVAYKEGLFEQLIHYYEYQKEGLIEIKEFIEPRVYYNLSLFNELIGNYNDAYRFLSTYLDYSSSLDPMDYHDALLGIPRLSTKSGNYEKGIQQYEELLPRISDSEYKKQRSIILSNILFNIPKLKEDFNLKKIEAYVKELTEMLPEILKEREFPSELMVNIGIGYALMNKTKESNDYVRRAFEYSESSELKANIIIDAFNSIEGVSIELIVKNIIMVNIEELTRKDQFMLVLLKLQKKLYNEQNSKYRQKIDNYIDKI